MDWQLAIAINVMALSALSVVFGLMRWRQADKTFLATHAGILIAGAAGLYSGFAYTGTLLSGMFVAVVLPGYLMLRANRATRAADYQRAARLATLAARLHPSAVMRLQAAMTRALASGTPEEAAAAIGKLQAGANDVQKTMLEATVARLEARWDDLLAITQEAGPKRPELLEFKIRALGETGRIDEMVRTYQASKASLHEESLRNCQLFLLAFSGYPEAVALLTQAPRQPMHPEFAAYWSAVATFHTPAGRDEGRRMLERLAQSAGLANVQRAAQSALITSVAPQSPVDPVLMTEAAAVAQRWQENTPLRHASLLRSPVTLALLVANGIMFALEYYFGGPEDLAALYQLGALWPGTLADPAEWWRVPAAMFLHFGWPHLIMNMLSLGLLGRMVEASFGSARMALMYALAWLGSMAMVVGLMQAQIIQPSFLVGASGAVMGLIGAWTARTLLQYVKTRDVLDRRSVGALGLVMLGQFALDLSVPQVSFTAHATGFVIGLLLGLLLGRKANTAKARGSAGR